MRRIIQSKRIEPKIFRLVRKPSNRVYRLRPNDDGTKTAIDVKTGETWTDDDRARAMRGLRRVIGLDYPVEVRRAS